MTRERKLAIELWIKIREKIREEDISPREVRFIKEVFVAENKLNWKHKCYFCEYLRDETMFKQGCGKCPIAKAKARRDDDTCGCGQGSVYQIACNYNLPRFIRIMACNRIIEALSKEYR